MANCNPPVKNQAFDLGFTLYKTDGSVIANPGTLTAKISKDFGDYADIGTTSEEDTTYGQLKAALTATEMNADCVMVYIKDDTSGCVPFTATIYTCSATRGLAGTALPDAAADAAGGLAISDAGGLDLDTYIKRLEAAWTAALAARLDENVSAAKTLTSAYDAAKTAAAAGAKMDLVDAPNSLAVGVIQSGLAASGEAATAAGAVTVAGYATGQDPATLLGTGSTLTALATSASITTLANRLGAFTGSGVNTVLGFLKALMSKAASTPSDVGGTFAATTDSVEALQEQGSAIKLITDTMTGAPVTVTSPVADSGALTIYQGDDYATSEGRQISFAVADASHVYGLDTATCKLKLFQATWTGTATSTGTGYTVVFTPTDTQTAALTATSQQYELEATLANGHIVTLARGSVTLVKDIPAVAS